MFYVFFLALSVLHHSLDEMGGKNWSSLANLSPVRAVVAISPGERGEVGVGRLHLGG